MKIIPNTFQRLRNWVEAVDYSDPEQKRLAIILQWTTIISIAVLLLTSLIYIFLDFYPRTVQRLVIISLILSATVWFVRNKYQSIGKVVFLGAILGIITYELYVRNGVHSIGVILYPIMVVIASSILSRRTFLIFLGFVLLSLGFVLYAEGQGWIPFKSLEPPSFGVFLIYSLILGSTALVSKLLNESLQMALSCVRQNERELAAQKTMLNRVGQAVIGCQIDNTIIYWNQAATYLYGWKAEEALGRQYYEVIPTQLSPEMAGSIRTTLRKGEVWSGEMAVQRHDQSSLSIIGTITPLYDVRGTITGWIAIATDLTERKITEQIARQRANEIWLLYQVGLLLASGNDPYTTLFALQAEIVKLIQADVFYIGIYDNQADMINFPIFFNEGEPIFEKSRKLTEEPGLTGAVIFLAEKQFICRI
jgi:PAS domain S-box-containing protein